MVDGGPFACRGAVNTGRQWVEVDASIDEGIDTGLSAQKTIERVEAGEILVIARNDDDENDGDDGAANGEKAVRDPINWVGKDEVFNELETWCSLLNTIGAPVETNGDPEQGFDGGRLGVEEAI